MSLFRYFAHDESGKPAEGTLDAMSREAAFQALLDMRLTPDRVESIGESAWAPVDALQKSPLPQERFHLQGGIESDSAPPQESISREHLPVSKSSTKYVPFSETLRLYAGWLLAGYFVAYALGEKQITGTAPFRIPYVVAFVHSSLILSFTLAAFLYLLLTDMRKHIPGGKITSLVLWLGGAGTFFLYRMNT